MIIHRKTKGKPGKLKIKYMGWDPVNDDKIIKKSI